MDTVTNVALPFTSISFSHLQFINNPFSFSPFNLSMSALIPTLLQHSMHIHKQQRIWMFYFRYEKGEIVNFLGLLLS